MLLPSRMKIYGAHSIAPWSLHCYIPIRRSDIRLTSISHLPSCRCHLVADKDLSADGTPVTWMTAGERASLVCWLMSARSIYSQNSSDKNATAIRRHARASYHGTERRLIGVISLSSDRGKKRNGKIEKSRDKVKHVEMIIDHWLADFYIWSICHFFMSRSCCLLSQEQ